MSIQCGICKNVMPSASFLNHKERKHSMLDHVPYVKVSEDQAKKSGSSSGKNSATYSSVVAATVAAATADVAGPLVKCRFCPNRIAKTAMERHLQRCHIDCHLCGKTLLKSNRTQHMQQKHAADATTAATKSSSSSSTIGDGGNLPEMAVFSQSKSSIQSDSDESLAAMSTVNSSPVFDLPTYAPIRMPFKSYASSLSSSLSTLSLLSSTPPPLPQPQLPLSSSYSSSPLPISSPSPLPIPSAPAVKPSIQSDYQQPSPSSAQESNVLHVDIWQLARYIRQGRVYKSNGWLYLRNSAGPSIQK